MASNTAIDYNEIQENEIQLLESMHSENFEHVATHVGAWSTPKKNISRTFRLKITPPSDPEAAVALTVRFTATYPRTAPALEVDALEQFHERTQKKIRRIVQERPKKLTGDDPFIHIITEEIADALEDAVTARKKGALPSLDDERATATETANALAKQAEEAEAAREQQRLEAELEEESALLKMAKVHVARQEKRKSLNPAKELLPKQTAAKDEMPRKITFEHSSTIDTTHGSETFTDVLITGILSHTASETTFLASPTTNGIAALVSIKRRFIKKPKSEIINLESVLAAAQKLKHQNLLNIYAYRVSQAGARTELYICREFADRGTLHDHLSHSEVHLPGARQLTLELLQGLDFLHQHGMIHGYITTRTVYLSGTSFSPKLSGFGYSVVLGLYDENLPDGWRFSKTNAESQSSQRKDIWDLGTVVVQIFLGLQVIGEFANPQQLYSRRDLSRAFVEFLRKMFSTDKKATSCFDLIPSELLRSDTPIVNREEASTDSVSRRGRHNSANIRVAPLSRYETEFTQLSRLGKGGFGEVVKAQNRLDQGVYAVKKIKQSTQFLDKVLQEVILLNRLNHPYVVRYFATWIEAEVEKEEDAVSTSSEESSPGVDFGYSTGGIDFVSNSHAGFEFGNDSEGNADESVEGEGSEGESMHDPPKTVDRAPSTPHSSVASHASRKSWSGPRQSTLYIQMELCDKRSLRNLIRDGMTSDEVFRFARQITEGLDHIHSNAIIHRDLKPDNVFIDSVGNPKIGDFGLATTSQYTDPTAGSKESGSGDMTRSVGTALYVAPELQSTGNGRPSDKVDMFSLGIIIYEMSQPFGTAMERVVELNRIRKKGETLPEAYLDDNEKAREGRLINCLIAHKPSERLSSAELLRDDRLPINIEDATVRKALGTLTDPNSPYHQTFMSAVFAQSKSATTAKAKSLPWEVKANTKPDDPERVRLRGITRTALETVFRRHCAEEVRRDFIFPRSHYYQGNDVVQLLDASGNVLQLPYDLTLPYARQLARQPASTRCTFTVSGAYRDPGNGGPPKNTVEADFDIINNGEDKDITINDAEILQVMDEILSELPFFAPDGSVYYWMTHGALVEAVMDHCRVSHEHRSQVKNLVSRLGFDRAWDGLQSELRKVGLTDTTLADLKKFDWHDSPEKAFKKLDTLFSDATERIRRHATIAMNELRKIYDLAISAYGLSRKLQIRPLSCWNVKFYTTGMLFQCVVEDRKHSRTPIAAGGRYDSLISAHRILENSTASQQGAVGLVFAVDSFVTNILKTTAAGTKNKFTKKTSSTQPLAKRGDVLVVAGGTEGVQAAGIKLVASLWAKGVSAELARDQDSRSMSHLFVVHLRHEASTTVRFTSTDNDAEDVDIAVNNLASHVQQELRVRAQSKNHMSLLPSASSHQESDQRGKVQVLMVERGGKKENKFSIVENAHSRWEDALEEWKNAEILAIEGRDSLLDLVQKTKLSDAGTWRNARDHAAATDKNYLFQIREALEGLQKKWQEGNGLRVCCVHHFRSGKIIYYDLGA
ncbi:uncharacterized protein MYCFIDRAFT_43169 [Pseudocercospora fijiensis CIRAD86]|uniref:non-specific serine/threonine protein kinase n=1 Tax=Pseudocercospora fijiensis (strain CIRAD86) TaxID=383855 RepID=M3AXP0_PSEFD|nr:uncharacterized protein MYCFIDRAFT_43169 [Pseudocercospora fijiensis CIRAD86]EME82227.1 hypothetical protein MYCFIDRAFT_43169 [Pseudocercospora fijiensis CIRAD86]